MVIFFENYFLDVKIGKLGNVKTTNRRQIDMDKTTLNDLKRLCDDYYTINEDVLTEDDVAHIHNLKTAIDKALTETELSTGDFAFWLNQQEDERLKSWAVIVLDWDPATKSLKEWLIYLSKTLDEHISNLHKEGNW